ncbi:MAG TPA: glycerol kinase GlpK [bacterium]
MALDQGTTSCRTILFGQKGEVVAVAQREFPQHYPQPGWVEHRLDEIWTAQSWTIRAALKKAGRQPSDVRAIGITNQRETTGLWSRKTGEPVGPAIVWQCRRTAPQCEAIRQRGDEPWLRDKTGLVADAYFSATKLAWLLDNIPGARKRAEAGELAFGTMDTWLMWKLTGGATHATDPSNASRTLMYDLRLGGWSPELVTYFNVPTSVLPQIQPTSGVMGETSQKVFGAKVPIASAIGDQQSALFGQGCFTPGTLKNTYGTGCFLLMNTGETPIASKGGLITSAAWRMGGKTLHILEGSIFIGGAVVQWLRDGLQVIKSAKETEALAKSVADTGGVYLVPAFVGLGAPYWKPEARGAVVGITRGTTRAHLARAALESIAFQSAEMVHLMSDELGKTPPALRVDGGATANNFLCQFQADLAGVPVERPKLLETTAAGAGYLAGIATGFWSGLEEVAAIRKVDRVFEPKQSADWRQAKMAEWKKAVQRVLL